MDRLFSLFKSKPTWLRVFPYVLVIGGMIGVLASSIITLDKIELLQNPQALFPCDLNPIFSCGSVMESPQASAFGFTNTLIGIVGFAVVTTIGMSILAGARFKRWFWLGLQFGTSFGLIFTHWLAYQSIYRIGSLCLYCMLVWTIMIPTFLYTTFYNLKERNIKLDKKYHHKVIKFLEAHHAKLLVVWYLVIVSLILIQFWDFWSSIL